MVSFYLVKCKYKYGLISGAQESVLIVMPTHCHRLYILLFALFVKSLAFYFSPSNNLKYSTCLQTICCQVSLHISKLTLSFLTLSCKQYKLTTHIHARTSRYLSSPLHLFMKTLAQLIIVFFHNHILFTFCIEGYFFTLFTLCKLVFSEMFKSMAY